MIKDEEGIPYESCRITNFDKLDIRDGVIHYKLYNQEGDLTPMTIKNTYENRLFVSWVQIHDRYTVTKKIEE